MEKAYQMLFKMVSDGFSFFQEDEYEFKKRRLQDFGFVDYYDSLVYTSTFVNLPQLKAYIKNKQGQTGEVDILAKTQLLPSTALAPFV